MKAFKTSSKKDFLSKVRLTDVEYLHELELLAKLDLPFAYVTDSFFVKQDEYTVRIRHRDIMWLKADGNYTEVYISDREKHVLLVHNIGRVEQLLPRRYFVRISRSVIINTHFIDRMCGNALYIKDQSFKIDKSAYDSVFSCFCILKRYK